MFSVDLNFEWNEEAMIFHEFLLIFLFRLKGYLDWQHFRKRHSESYLITKKLLCSKSLLKTYETHWQQYFERHPTIEPFKDVDQDKP